uniref:NADH-ubiquinone oxidoreductase chain 2 n=1 Tax=Atrocalopteryx atrata TaxID=193161 RepID=A0A0F7J3H0_9ODON|nr:NADH dehydrogenase subunit 2 [Atrocalopteryx atrata]AKH04376.1 NADH dehydrogenase subunit 2 [Atrocalopteryx atrata]
MNLSFMLFLCTLTTGTMLSISSSEWIIMWIGMEVNLMSFIPMMKTGMSPYESEASMKYFIVQALASTILMMAVLMEMNSQATWTTTLMLALFLKMGAAPFHIWYPGVMQGISWSNCVILMTWQKIAPMIMISYLMTNNTMTMIIITMSVMVGAIGTMNQTSLRKLMAYSSISHLGWLIMAMLMSNYYWMMYFMLYSTVTTITVMMFWNMSMYHLTQIMNMKMDGKIKTMLFSSILSLGGMPPFTGFIPKWILIQNMINSENYIMTMIMVMSTLMTLYAYMRMTYTAFSMSNQITYWQVRVSNQQMMFMLMSITLMGIPMIGMVSLP